MCGIIAVYAAAGAKATAASLVYRGLLALQHRGQESAGIVTLDDAGEIHQLRGRGLVLSALPQSDALALPGHHAVGHVRYSTVPVDRAENIQPFVAGTPFGKLALCHNGNLKNAATLEQKLLRGGAIFSTTMDSELLAHLLARAAEVELEAALAQAAAQAAGAYSLTLLCGDRLFGLRDPHGLRPLVIGELEAGCGLVLASETCALEAIGARYLREVRPGELVEIGPTGLRSRQLLPPAAPLPCVFELVYFARPDSRVFEQNVHAARLRMGEELARADAALSTNDNRLADVVVPVPHSGVAAALGYARQSGLPLDEAILCNPLVEPLRTFILPDAAARAEGVRSKLSVVADSVVGKRVLLVDDSLVRGTTARQLVMLLREAGARSILLRIASPPIIWPCYLGIDMPSRADLVMNQQGSVEAVARHIGADDLRYLDLAGLRRAVGQDATENGATHQKSSSPTGPKNGATHQKSSFCMACMDGHYPL